jgi:Fe-S cluster biosynthesis and repair protein YggX
MPADLPQATVQCARCGRPDAPALGRAPLPGALGRELLGRVCADCWGEWQRVEVMVINELRLNFMDPNSQSVLDQQLRQFFLLDGPAGGAPGLPVTP